MIEARDIRVRFGSVWALRGVSLELDPGRVVGVIGPPGSGKTTLLKTLAGLTTLARGQVFLDGQRVDTLGELERGVWHQQVGLSFQNNALFDSLTVYENVAFPLRRRRWGQDETDAAVRHALCAVGLWEAREKMPADLSGGMRKRAGVARAVVIRPETGLFDNPIAGLDPETGAQILAHIVSLTADLGMATAVISNDLPVLLPICHRVIMLHEGLVIYDGVPAGLSGAERREVFQFFTGSDEGPL